jgi:DNA-directed RNA polymerase subunit K/omega
LIIYLKLSTEYIVAMSDIENDLFNNSDDNDSDVESDAESELGYDEINNKKTDIKKKPPKPPTDDIEADDDDEEDVDDDVDADAEDEDYVSGDDNAAENEDDIEVDADNEDDADNETDEYIPKKRDASVVATSTGVSEFDNQDGNTDDDEDENDEDYLQKFDADIKKNYIVDYHPECMVHNYEEISALAKVVRDKDNIIVDPLHRTIPYLTKYERARVLGQRAKQINMGAKPFVKVPENIIDGHLVAEIELAQKRIPFILRRPLPGNSGSEYWNLKDLEIITF